jgi:hypothetical protein
LGSDLNINGKGDQMKLTKRGKRVRAVFILVAIVAAWQVMGHLWWVGDGYCWGGMTECMLGDK